MNDLGKVAVIAAIMGAILLVGIAVAPTKQEPVVQEEPVVITSGDVTVLQEDTLEMLDPVYSEKAVFQDPTIRIAFDASYTEEGLQSRLPFWLHNVSGDVINILWGRCSIQLPNGNTVKVLSEENLTYLGAPGTTISIAPSGDLFDAIIPVSEFNWDQEGGWSVSSDVLDGGTFTFVRAIEGGEPRPSGLTRMDATRLFEDECADEPILFGRQMLETLEGRSIIYYTFRFVVR